MTRTDYLEKIKYIIEEANNELSQKDMYILASNIRNECIGFMKEIDVNK